MEQDKHIPKPLTKGRLLIGSLAVAVLGVGIGFSTSRVITAQQNEKVFSVKRPNEVDIGFVNDMWDHHDQAVQMAMITLSRPGIHPITKDYALDVILFQRYEIGIFRQMLNTWGLSVADGNRITMVWMAMGSMKAKPSQMPGMATSAQLDALKLSSGRQADIAFLTMMRKHHIGGLSMARYAVEHANNPDVVNLAAAELADQQLEIGEYTTQLATYGIK